MSHGTIEQKLADLTARVEMLEAKSRPQASERWREAAGMMKDCDLFDEAIQAGAEWRAQMNREGR